jgi:hypothetical protein
MQLSARGEAADPNNEDWNQAFGCTMTEVRQSRKSCSSLQVTGATTRYAALTIYKKTWAGDLLSSGVLELADPVEYSSTNLSTLGLVWFLIRRS